MSPPRCPYCDAQTSAEYVDIGVGYQQATAAECGECEAAQVHPYHVDEESLGSIERKTGWHLPRCGLTLAISMYKRRLASSWQNRLEEIRRDLESWGFEELAIFAPGAFRPAPADELPVPLIWRFGKSAEHVGRLYAVRAYTERTLQVGALGIPPSHLELIFSRWGISSPVLYPMEYRSASCPMPRCQDPDVLEYTTNEVANCIEATEGWCHSHGFFETQRGGAAVRFERFGIIDLEQLTNRLGEDPPEGF